MVADHDFDPERLGTRAHDRNRLRVAVLGHEKSRCITAPTQLYPGAFVEHRGIRDVERGQLADKCLKVE